MSGPAGPELAQVVLLHVIAERPEAHAEQLGRLHLHAAGPLQGLRDVVALDLLDVRLEIEASRRQRVDPAACASRGRAASQRRAAGSRAGRSGVASSADGALDDVLELADVAGPVVRAAAAPSRSCEIPVTGFPICSAYFARKWSASSGMSSRRSRSGGSAIGITLMR